MLPIIEIRIIGENYTLEEIQKIRLSENEAYLISQTPQKECWLCNYFRDRIYKDEYDWYMLRKDMLDDGMKEHLRQLIGRVVE